MLTPLHNIRAVLKKRSAFREFEREKSLSRGELHQIRVTIRQLRVALWYVKKGEAQSARDSKQVDRRLKEINALLGKNRELDIALQDAKHYGLPRHKLKTSRQKIKRKIANLLGSKHVGKISARLDSLTDALLDDAAFDPRRTFGKLEKELRQWLARPHLSEQEAHRLRIAVKKIRYSLMMFHQPLQPFKTLQDHLGRAHDLRVLQTLTGERKRLARDERRELEIAEKLTKPALRGALARLRKIRLKMRRTV